MLCIKNWGILLDTTVWCWFLLGQINYLRHSDIFVFRRRLKISISNLLSDHPIWTHNRGWFIPAQKPCPVSWQKSRIWTTWWHQRFKIAVKPPWSFGAIKMEIGKKSKLKSYPRRKLQQVVQYFFKTCESMVLKLKLGLFLFSVILTVSLVIQWRAWN